MNPVYAITKHVASISCSTRFIRVPSKKFPLYKITYTTYYITMKTKHAYIQAVSNAGVITTIKIDMQNPQSEHKLRNLMAGSVTTFTILEEDGFKVAPGDIIESATKTVYPNSLAYLDVKVVISESH